MIDTSDRDEEQRKTKTRKKKKKKKKSSTKKTKVVGESMTHQYEAKLAPRMVNEHELEIKKLKSELTKTQLLGSLPTGVASSINVIFDSNVTIGSVVGSRGGSGGGCGFSILKKSSSLLLMVMHPPSAQR